MSEHTPAVQAWLVQTLAVGGGLLLAAAVLMAGTRQPVRRRMIGALAVRVALLVPLLSAAPKWLVIPLPAQAGPASTSVGVASEPHAVPRIPDASPTASGMASDAFVFVPLTDTDGPARGGSGAGIDRTEEPAAPTLRPSDAEAELARPFPWREAIVIGYGVGAAAFAARWLLAQAALLHLLGRSRPAGRALTELFARVAGPGPRPELRVVPDVAGPVCCGLMRPVVLLPQRLAESADEEALRWAFAHELAHLRRGDAWTAFWFGLAAAVYYPLPWFWWLRRQVGLCQEYVADAEAASGGRAEEYAAFLVNLSRSARAGRRPVAASGVLGSPSELYRRITMLLNQGSRVDQSCPRRWSLLAAGSFLSLAVLLSGVAVTRPAAAQDEPKEEKKEQPTKPKSKKGADEPQADPDEKFVRPRGARGAAGQPPEGFDPEAFQKQMEKQMQRMMEEMQKRFGERGFGGPMLVPGGANPFSGRYGPGSGRLGAVVERPHAALVEQLDLPKDQGLVLADVKADSAAAKAGLKPNDVLLELNGKPVSSDPQEFRKQLADIKADSAVDAVVLRKGKRETVKGIKLPEAKPEHGAAYPNDLVIPVPNLPNVPLPKIPPVPAVGDVFGGPGSKTMSVQIANDQFTVRSRDESLDVTVGGRIEDGKKTVNQVKIVDGGERHSYDKLENVPEKYREKVDALLKNVVIGKAK